MDHNEFDVKDDWLERERIRESKVSVWDLDETRKTRDEHEQDCDRQANAEFHERQHRRRRPVDLSATGERQQLTGRTGIWLISDIVLLVFLIMANVIFYSGSILPVMVLFLGINPGIFIWLFVFKKFPPEGYWKLLFYISLILEIYVVFESYIRFFIRRYL